MIKNNTHYVIVAIILLCVACNSKHPQSGNLSLFIEKGEYKQASEIINQELKDPEINTSKRNKLLFQLDMMKRIEREFSLTKTEVTEQLLPYFGDSAAIYLPLWIKNNSLENRAINGQTGFFKNAVSNLFRVDEFAKKRKTKLKGESVDPLVKYCLKHTGKLVKMTSGVGELIHPVNNTFNYTIRVKPDVVPAGETIRCWMPFPKEANSRQQEVDLIGINTNVYTIAPDTCLQRSIYCEKIAIEGKETVFHVKFKTKSFAQVYFPEKMDIKPYNKETEVYQKYTKEKPPHIVFTDRIKKLADNICGEETNALKQVELIYNWIDFNIPWASALEYSIMANIPKYVLDNMRGDCGMQTLLFMSLARYRGIPVKWQSGWMIHPGEVNLHDWCEVYYEGVGWVPLDQSFELQDSNDKYVREFYRTGIDAHRLIVNDDYSQELYPKKIWPRSEPVDFQRGELEWQGGNLYFSDWTYQMKVNYE